MDLHTLALVGGIVALASNFFLIWGVWRGTVHLNIATWLLWLVMDGSVLLASLAAGATAPFLSVGFVIGSLLVTISLLFKGSWQWGELETLCAFIALTCLGLWYFAGPLVSLVSLTLGKYGVAGIPTMIDAYRNPERKQGLIWTMGVFGSAANIFTLGSWTIVNSFFPTIALAFNVLVSGIHLFREKSVQ